MLRVKPVTALVIALIACSNKAKGYAWSLTLLVLLLAGLQTSVAETCPPGCSDCNEPYILCIGARLTSFPQLPLDLQESVEFLSLKCNDLTALDLTALENYTNLEFLDLAGNQLTELPEGLFDAATHLEFLYLHGNPLHCDCKLSWLHELLRNVTESEPATCATPANLKGSTVVSLTKNHLDCAGGRSHQLSNTGISYGASSSALAVVLLTISTIAFLSLTLRKYYSAKHRRRTQEAIADYASVPIVPTAGVELCPELPPRRKFKAVHMWNNVAYIRCQLEKQTTNEKEARSSGLRCATQVHSNDVASSVDTCETECDHISMIEFDDDGYPIMQRSGDILYMDVLPFQTSPNVTTYVSESHVTMEQCSKPKRHQECDEDDGYPSLW